MSSIQNNPLYRFAQKSRTKEFFARSRQSLKYVSCSVRTLFGQDKCNANRIPKRIIKKDWGDHTKPKPESKTRTQTNVKIRLDPRFNIVYNPPVQIYNNTTIINNNVPNKPGTNLLIEDTEENLAQSQTKVVIGKTITLSQAIENQEFGRLLHNPLIESPTKIKQVIDNNLEKKILELAEAGIDNFNRYLSGDSDSLFLDGCALILPESLRGLSGEINIFFGSEVIRLLSYYYTSASLNTFIGVSDSIPVNYEIVVEAPTYDSIKSEIKDFKISNLDNLKDLVLGEIKDYSINWESYINEAISRTYDKEADEELAIEPKSLADVVVNLVAQIYRRLGLDDYPLIVPKDLTQEVEKGGIERTVTSQSLVDFLLAQYQAFEGVLGQFPINIRVEDNDLIKTGDQPIDIRLPNIAETLAELTGKTLTNEALINAILAINLKTIAETGSSKQTAVQNYYLLTAIQEYLGFKTKQKSIELDLLFNPKVATEKEEDQSLTKALENSTVKVPVEVNDDEDSLEEQLKTLVEAARISKAKNWRGIDLRGDVFGQLKSIFTNAAKLSNDLTQKEKDTLEDFLNSLELGFSDKSGSIDNNKPFGREYNRRPRVRKLKTDE